MNGNLTLAAWRHLSGERRTIAALAVFSVILAQAEATGLALLALTGEAVVTGQNYVDAVIGPWSPNLSIPKAAAICGGALTVAGLGAVRIGYATADATSRLNYSWRNDVVSRLASADWEYQSVQTSGRVMGRVRITAPADALLGLVYWIRSGTMVLVLTLSAALMSLPTAGLMVGMGVVLGLAVFPFRRWSRRVSTELSSEDVRLGQDVVDAMDLGADAVVYGAWPTFCGRFRDRALRMAHLARENGRAAAWLPVVYQYGAFFGLLLFAVLLYWLSPGAGIGVSAAVALLLLRSVQYGQGMQSQLQVLARSVPYIERLKEEIAVPDPRVTFGTRELKRIELIELNNISYLYPNQSEYALNGLSMRIERGQVVGIAGPSGSGKSTLAQVLMRLRWPNSGEFLVNGVPATEYSVEDWGRRVVHVPQQPRVFHGSLMENVSLFSDDVTRDMAETSLRNVGLGDLLDSLPLGLETIVGPAQRGLSGGQVQRLGIARALARQPSLIVLDEPTSALDVESERLIQLSIASLSGLVDIVVVIAHRPSTLSICDHMYVVERGAVQASGATAEVKVASPLLASMMSRS